MYHVSYDVAASRHVCCMIHTTTTLRSFRRRHADAALVAHLWVHSGQQHCQKHNAVQGMRCIPSCSRQTPTIRTAIRPHTYDDAHPTFALVERYSFIFPSKVTPSIPSQMTTKPNVHLCFFYHFSTSINRIETQSHSTKCEPIFRKNFGVFFFL